MDDGTHGLTLQSLFKMELNRLGAVGTHRDTNASFFFFCYSSSINPPWLVGGTGLTFSFHLVLAVRCRRRFAIINVDLHSHHSPQPA